MSVFITERVVHKKLYRNYVVTRSQQAQCALPVSAMARDLLNKLAIDPKAEREHEVCATKTKGKRLGREEDAKC